MEKNLKKSIIISVLMFGMLASSTGCHGKFWSRTKQWFSEHITKKNCATTAFWGYHATKYLGFVYLLAYKPLKAAEYIKLIRNCSTKPILNSLKKNNYSSIQKCSIGPKSDLYRGVKAVDSCFKQEENDCMKRTSKIKYKIRNPYNDAVIKSWSPIFDYPIIDENTEKYFNKPYKTYIEENCDI